MSSPTGDFGQDYLERRQQSTDDALDQEYASILSGAQPPQPQPAQPADPQLQDPSTTAPSGGPSLIGRVGSDVVRGTVAIPSEALGGAVDAVHQEASTVKDLADWVSTKLPNALRGGIAYTPGQGLHFASGDEIQALPGALESIAGLIPTTEGSGTVTGGAARAISQFVTGKAILGPILGNLGNAGALGSAAEQAAVGATAFDPQQHVSDLIQQVPALANPVNEWLSSQPGDTAAEGRLKNAIEGMGLGLASEGLFRALKAVKAKIFSKYAERAAGDEQGLARQVVTQVDEQNRALAEIIGDPAQPAVTVQPKIPQTEIGMPSEQAARAIADSHATGPGEVKVNWSALHEEQDVKAAIQTLADAYQPEMAAAKGFKSWAATRASAAETDAWQVVRGEVPRGSLDEGQMLALKEFYIQSGRETKRLADMVAAGRGGDFARIAFDRQLTLHSMIQTEFAGAKATAARTLNILKTRGNVNALQQAEQFSQLRREVSGSRIDELAKGISQYGSAGKVREMDAFIAMNQGGTRADRVRQLWYAGLLSNPTTHTKNITWNLANTLIDLPDTALAEGNDVAAEKLFGLVSSYRDAWTLIKRGRDVIEGQVTSGLDDALSNSRMDRQVGGAFRPEAMGLDPNSVIGRFYSIVDAATTWQGKFMDRADTVSKAMNWHMERRAIAYRQVKDELARGVLKRPEAKSRLAFLMQNPSEQAKQDAIAFAEVKTFQNQPLNTSWYQAVDRMSRVKFWGPFLLPFKKTPYNVATQILQRTPAAPFMTSWAQDITAGGVRAEQAWSRFVLGNALMLTAADLVLSGHLTGQGPSNPDVRATLARQGWKPYSFVVGDPKDPSAYIDIRSLGPIAGAMGMAAFTAETVAGQDFSDETGFDRTQQVVSAATLSIAANMLDYSMLTGISNVMDAINDPKRAGQTFIEKSIGAAVIPRGVAALERLLDPTQRAAHGVVDSLRAQTPWLSESLPERRDLWGRPIRSESGNGWVYDMVSPFPMSQANAEPIDREITRLGARISAPSQKISFNVLVPGRGFESATVDLWNRQDIYQRYLQLAGQEVPERLSGKPLLRALNDLVEGKHPLSPLYQRLTDGPDGGKSDQIRKMLHDTQEEARRRLLQEYPELLDASITKASRKPGKFDLQ